MTLEEFNQKMTRLINGPGVPLYQKVALREALRDVVGQLHEINSLETQYGIKPPDDGLNYPPRAYQRV